MEVSLILDRGKIMKTKQAKSIMLEFYPVTPARWPDFETLFGEKGACGGCWCMLWRLTRKRIKPLMFLHGRAWPPLLKRPALLNVKGARKPDR